MKQNQDCISVTNIVAFVMGFAVLGATQFVATGTFGFESSGQPPPAAARREPGWEVPVAPLPPPPPPREPGAGISAAVLTEGYCKRFDHFPKKYFLFEPWAAGWNNRRLGIEVALMLTMSSGRTLVLPPTTDGIGDEHISAGGRMLNYDDVYDLEQLRSRAHVPTFTEFMECFFWGGLAGKPAVRGDADHTCGDHPENKRYFWCRRMRPIWTKVKEITKMGSFRQGQIFVPLPFNASATYPGLENKKPGPHPEEGMKDQQVVYWHDMLINYGCWLVPDPTAPWSSLGLPPLPGADPSQTLKQQLQGAVRDGLVYNRHITGFADQVVASLGGEDAFSCMHIRRGDFLGSRKESIIEPSLVLRTYADILKPGERVLILTDREAEVKKALEDAAGTFPDVQVVFFGETPPMQERPPRQTFVPHASQTVCEYARQFIGVSMSTVSSYIVKRRGFRKKVSYYLEATPERKPENPETMQPYWLPKSQKTTWGYEPAFAWDDL